LILDIVFYRRQHELIHLVELLDPTIRPQTTMDLIPGQSPLTLVLEVLPPLTPDERHSPSTVAKPAGASIRRGSSRKFNAGTGERVVEECL
jgi:hypothetical protein